MIFIWCENSFGKFENIFWVYLWIVVFEKKKNLPPNSKHDFSIFLKNKLSNETHIKQLWWFLLIFWYFHFGDGFSTVGTHGGFRTYGSHFHDLNGLFCNSFVWITYEKKSHQCNNCSGKISRYPSSPNGQSQNHIFCQFF